MGKNTNKYLWFSDCHIYYWQYLKLLNSIQGENAKGIFITGDESNGLTLSHFLHFIGKNLSIPVYFVLGNHSYWTSSFKKTEIKVSSIIEKYDHLHWLTKQEVMPLTDEIAIIGEEGWYDAAIGNRNYIKYTLDWLFIKDFRVLKSWDDRFDMFKELARVSAVNIQRKLLTALRTYDTIYLLSHFPPYEEAGRYNSIFNKKFWEPYNNNIILGKTINEVMKDYPNKNVKVLCGHSHSAATVNVSSNVECRVGRGSYLALQDDERLFL